MNAFPPDLLCEIPDSVSIMQYTKIYMSNLVNDSLAWIRKAFPKVVKFRVAIIKKIRHLKKSKWFLLKKVEKSIAEYLDLDQTISEFSV